MAVGFAVLNSSGTTECALRYPSDTTANAIRANIVAAGYSK